MSCAEIMEGRYPGPPRHAGHPVGDMTPTSWRTDYLCIAHETHMVECPQEHRTSDSTGLIREGFLEEDTPSPFTMLALQDYNPCPFCSLQCPQC